MDTIRIPRPIDGHVHWREGQLLRDVIAETAQIYRAALVMPNTVNFGPYGKAGIATGPVALAYRDHIKEVLGGGHPFQPLLTIKLSPQTTPEIVREAKALGVVAAKLYPDGVTTNSEGGVRDFAAMDSVFAAMADVGMVLSIHGEMPDAFCLDREVAFLNVLRAISRAHPLLKIVLEHITTAEAVDTVMSLHNVAATITVHHLFLTLDDVIGGMLQPHHFCKPVAKRPEDRVALIKAASSGNPRFFLGTDSAPHRKEDKESANGCAGVFVPGTVALPLLVQIFEREGALDKLAAFTSVNGAKFYGLPPADNYIEIVRESQAIPPIINGVVPFMAGQTIGWSIPREYWQSARG